eukprot:gene36597-biopygen11307
MENYRYLGRPSTSSPDTSCMMANTTIPYMSVNTSVTLIQATEEDMAVYIQNVGPLLIMVYASNWQHYSSGIMTAASCGYTGYVNHVVQLVGVNLAITTAPYWI